MTTPLLTYIERLDLPPRLARWRPHVLASALNYGVDAALIFAIMDRESLGGEALQPRGAQGVGDNGHGRGLMQIDDRYHRPFLDAVFDDRRTPLWTDPGMNIAYGTWMLGRNLRACGGDQACAIAAYNCGLTRALRVCAVLPDGMSPARRVRALDEHTVNNYVSDVLRRRDSFLKIPASGDEHA